MKVFAIIPAAGLGTRMSAGRSTHGPSKQFTHLNGVPILIHTLRRFGSHGKIDKIIVALRANEIKRFTETLSGEPYAAKVQLVAGGDTRHESVQNGLKALSAAPTDIVLVHDAVRPFIDANMLDQSIAAAQRHGAAIVGLPAVDTIKLVERTADGAIISSTVPRERVVNAQTPQAFQFELLQKAFSSAAEIGFIGTDEASLVERLGHQVAVVMGSPRNIKITTPADMELAEFYLKNG
jgi:2-C-methyl-D-erythritol 4-phosphate cytidylyltransferase